MIYSTGLPITLSVNHTEPRFVEFLLSAEFINDRYDKELQHKLDVKYGYKQDKKEELANQLIRQLLSSEITSTELYWGNQQMNVKIFVPFDTYINSI